MWPLIKSLAADYAAALFAGRCSCISAWTWLSGGKVDARILSVSQEDAQYSGPDADVDCLLLTGAARLLSSTDVLSAYIITFKI